MSGSPGVGKSSLSRELVERSGGVHLHSDDFYSYLRPRIPPHLPESHDQNITVVNALTRAAAAYAEGGYAVYLDGVIGPWFLPRYARALASCDVPTHYVVLRLPLELALSRVHARGDHGIDDVVRQMHAEFADLGDFESHVVDAQPILRTLADTLSAALARGDYRLDLGQVAARPGM